jgi:hypothetical protein
MENKMNYEKGAQFFLMGQFGALSAITWITNDMKEKHDKQMAEHSRHIAENSKELKELRDRIDKRWWY